jgi:hypothetical protein
LLFNLHHCSENEKNVIKQWDAIISLKYQSYSSGKYMKSIKQRVVGFHSTKEYHGFILLFSENRRK